VSIKPSKKDRLLLINQYKILAAIETDSKSHYEELIEILENGYSIFYNLVEDWIDDDMSEEDGKFVLDILDLYRAIEDLKRSSKNKDLLEHHLGFFRGFDGNNETQFMAFCRFLIEKQGKFAEQKPYLLRNDNLNSHSPMVEIYRRMLIRSKQIPSIWEMTPTEALEILNA
jgi:uncharacterized protein YfbU (UPF0304 family)